MTLVPERLGSPPDEPKRSTHAYADYIELMCLVDLDEVLSVGRMGQLLEPTGHGASGNLLEADDLEGPADLATRRGQDVYSLLRHRAPTFGSWYPFEVAGNELRRIPMTSDRHRLYTFLLMCANLRHFPREQGTLTGAFERLGAVTLRRLSPNSTVDIFGTSTRGRFSGSLVEKRKALARALGEQYTAVKDPDPQDVGDGGLDYVAETSLGDDSNGRLLIFGQAACTDAWKVKQHSAKPELVRRYMTLLTPHVTACLIPHSFRDANGAWHDEDEIGETLLIDRPRARHLLDGAVGESIAVLGERTGQNETALDVVESFLQFRLDPI